MNILILSCDTGGGHNSAGQAIAEELTRRGHEVIMTDPFRLSSYKLAGMVGGAYVKLVQKHPKIFGFVYYLGALITKLPFRSPVYYANSLMASRMQKYLEQNRFDVIVMPHLYPAEIMTCLKHRGIDCPKTLFIATDYACIPFTEETNCDYYIIPHSCLARKFTKRGIPAAKLLPFGIPVKQSFLTLSTKEASIRKLGLEPDRTYFLVMGGSMGAGNLKKLVKCLADDLQEKEQLLIICGNNTLLYNKLSKLYKNDHAVSILGQTSDIADYMRVSSIVYSKPGGLSSTEAAVVGVPLVHITPIPGCESHNRHFFRKHRMSVSSDSVHRQAHMGRKLYSFPAKMQSMIENQHTMILKSATASCCDFIEKL